MNSKKLVKYIDKNINGRICSKDYIHKLYDIKEQLGDFCKTYLEIGVLHGGTMSLLMQSKFKTKFIGIDNFNYYGRNVDDKCNIVLSLNHAKANIDSFNKNNYKYRLIEGDSTKDKIYDSVKNENIQLLLIDGDHTYKGVTNDFILYSPLVEKGGMIFFDDYGHTAWPGVKEAVDKIVENIKLGIIHFKVVEKGKYYLIIERTK
jgi:cephalosporin hydroxylase